MTHLSHNGSQMCIYLLMHLPGSFNFSFPKISHNRKIGMKEALYLPPVVVSDESDIFFDLVQPLGISVLWIMPPHCI